MSSNGQFFILSFLQFDINEVLFFEDGLDGSIAENVVDEGLDWVLGLGRGTVGLGGVLFEQAAVFGCLLPLIELLSQQ